MDKVKYTCKNCGWSDTLPAQWADIKPKRCMNRKCNTSFRKEPEALLVENPIETRLLKEQEERRKKAAEQKAKKDESSKTSKSRSSSKQQQTKKEDSTEHSDQGE